MKAKYDFKAIAEAAPAMYDALLFIWEQVGDDYSDSVRKIRAQTKEALSKAGYKFEEK